MERDGNNIYDIVIIGGGINGCGIARDAAGRGYRVLLAEKGDLAEGTSSGSTKLIHGGLRYLEHYEFRLVRESLKERERLWAIAPHIIWPLRFVLPHLEGGRPAWLLRLGLALYDHIGGRRKLPATRVLDLSRDPVGVPLKQGFSTAFEYSDCWVDDARLVVLNARDAADHGASIRTRTIAEKLKRDGKHWLVTLRNRDHGTVEQVAARMVINAAGPWVDDVAGKVEGPQSRTNERRAAIRHVQGSHIVVARLFDDPRCYIFQNPDGRIFFAIPYEDDFTLIGTTDSDYDGPLDDISISSEEIDYLCTAVNQYLRNPISPSDVVWSYSAVRPLFDDGSANAKDATRDYVLKLDGERDEAKMLNVIGGKITTYRRLAEEALRTVDAEFAHPSRPWTASEPLPGGDFPVDGQASLARDIATSHPYLDQSTVRRMVRSYGTIAAEILNGATSMKDLGHQFGAGLTEREVDHLRRNEWAASADDILWRRSKLGLKLTHEQRADVADWLDKHPLGTASL